MRESKGKKLREGEEGGKGRRKDVIVFSFKNFKKVKKSY